MPSGFSCTFCFPESSQHHLSADGPGLFSLLLWLYHILPFYQDCITIIAEKQGRYGNCLASCSGKSSLNLNNSSGHSVNMKKGRSKIRAVGTGII